MLHQTSANCRSAITVAGALTLFGCDSTPTDGVPEDDFFVVTGLVLEYTDATRTTTVPVVDAMLEVILPDGETREECFGNIFGGPVNCIDVEWVAQAWTNMDSTGLYRFEIEDPEHCALRVRAYSGHINTIPIKTGKTATVPRLAEVCENHGIQDGPTLIIQ